MWKRIHLINIFRIDQWDKWVLLNILLFVKTNNGNNKFRSKKFDLNNPLNYITWAKSWFCFVLWLHMDFACFFTLKIKKNNHSHEVTAAQLFKIETSRITLNFVNQTISVFLLLFLNSLLIWCFYYNL